MKINKLSKILAPVIVVASLIGCGNNTSGSIQEGQSGEEVVIATSVAVTEILDELGVKVSGVPTTSYELPESTKDAVEVGNPMSPDLEVIKSLNPTVVVSVDTLGSDYEKLFTDNNIPSEFVSLSSLDGLKETIITLGERFNKEEKATELINSINKKEEEVERLNDDSENVDVLVLFAAPGSTMIATSKSYIGSLVEIAGGRNIIEDTSSSYVTYNKEELTKLNPDKILVMMHAYPEETKKALEKEFATDTAWQSIPAVTEGNIVYLDSNYFGMSANLKVIEGLGMLHDIIYESEQ